LEKNKRSRDKGSPIVEREGGQRSPSGLEIEAGFKKWIAYVREHFGRSYSWDGPFANDLERVNAIDAETALLLKIAPDWSAEKFCAERMR